MIKKELNKKEIENLLPHREPMLLIDKLINIVSLKSQFYEKLSNFLFFTWVIRIFNPVHASFQFNINPIIACMPWTHAISSMSLQRACSCIFSLVCRETIVPQYWHSVWTRRSQAAATPFLVSSVPPAASLPYSQRNATSPVSPSSSPME